MNESGIIKGPGGPKDDSIISIEEPGTLIVPIEKVEEAKRLYKKYINKEIPLAKPSKDGVVVKISNEEFKLTPDDLQIFIEKGVDISSILPDYINNAKAGADGLIVEDDFTPIEDDFTPIEEVKKKASSIPLPITQEKLQEDYQKSPYQPASLQSESDSSTLESATTPSDSLKIPKTVTTTTTGDAVTDIKPSKDKTYSQEIIDVIGAGSARIGSSIARTPSLIYNLASVPQNLIAKYTGIPIQTSAEEFGKTIGIEENQVAKYYEDVVDKTKQGISEKYDKGVTEYLFGDNPDYEKGFKLLGLQVAESAPMSMALAMGGAAGLTPAQTTLGGGAVFAAEKMNELENSGAPLLEYEKLGIATSSGLLEGFFENVGITKLGALTKNLVLKEGADKAKEIAKKGFIDTYLPLAKKYIGIGAEESISEAATQFSQNAIDKYTGYKPDIDLMDGVSDAFIVGGVAGSGFAFTPASIELYQTSQARKEASELIAKKEAIESDISNPEIADEAKAQLSEAALDINEKLSDLYTEDKKLSQEIPEENRVEIKDLNEKLNNTTKALSDPLLNSESKSILEESKNNIEKKILELETIKPKEDAVQIESPTSVLQREQEITREEGSQREGMEPIKQGEEITITNQEEIIPKEDEKAKETTDKETLRLQEVEPQFSSEEEALRYTGNKVAEESNDPVEIINEYNRQAPESKLSYKQQIISDANIKVHRDSYRRFGDVNKVGMGLAKQFFTSKKSPLTSIDTIAQELSENAGVEITPQDIVDYMETAKYERKISDTQRKLENRFREVTGLPFSKKSIDKIFKEYEQKQNNKLETYLNKEANDYTRAEQDYYEAIRRGEIPVAYDEQDGVNISDGKIQKGGEGEVKTESKTLTDIPSEQLLEGNRDFNMLNNNPDDAISIIKASPNFSFVADIPKKLKKLWQKEFKKEGDLPLSVYKSYISSEGLRNAISHESNRNIRKLKDAVKQEYGDKISPEQVVEFNKGLKGEKPLSEFPDKVAEALLDLRTHIDNLSKMMIDNGVVEGNLVGKLQDNLGAYLTRSYRATDVPDWASKVPFEIVNRVKDFIRKQLGENATQGDVDGVINEILYKFDDDTPLQILSSGKLGSKDLSILKKRGDIAPEIRALWGEYNDPIVNYSKSIIKMSALISNSKFLNDVKEIGMNDFLFEKPNKEHFKEIVGKDSKTMAPLSGLYTTPEIKKAFEEFNKSEAFPNWLTFYLKINGYAKYAKTIGSFPLTHVRNFTANPLIMIRNGNFNLLSNKSKDSYKVLRNEFQKMDDKKFSELYKRYLKLGIAGESVSSSDLKAALKDANKNYDSIEGFSEGMVKKAIGKTTGFLEKLYDFEDTIYKIYSFESERAKYKEAYPNWTNEQLDEKAVDIVNKTTPTYSQVPSAIKKLRRFPLTGTFVSFPYEILRTTVSNVELAMEERKNPETKSIGNKRLLGTAVALSAMSVASLITRSLNNVSSDDDKDIREFMPDWMKNSEFAYFKNDGNGNYTIVDLGNTDPHGMFKKFIIGLIKGEEKLEALADGIYELLKPFIATEMLLDKLIDVKRNKTSEGKSIYNEQDDTLDKASKIYDHLSSALEPGTINAAKKVGKGLVGALDKSGNPYSWKRELVNQFTGQKFYEMSIAKQFGFGMSELSKDLIEAKKLYTGVKYDKRVTKDQIEEARLKAEEAINRILLDGNKKYNAALNLGVKKSSLRRTIEEIGITEDQARTIMFGKKYRLDK